MAVSSDSLRLAIIEEAEAGLTPGSPAWDLLRTTGEGLVYEVSTTQSEEMGGINRGVKSNILTGATVTGDINFELSKHVAFEMLLGAVVGNDWGDDPLAHPGTGPDFVYDYSTARTFSIEKRFTLDAVPTYDYHRFVGCLADTMNMSITPNEPITGSFGFIGQNMTTETTEAAGSTYTNAGTSPIMTAPLVTGIQLYHPAGISDADGTPLGTVVGWADESCFTGLDMTFSNNARGLQCIGILGNSEVVHGRFEVSASGSLYYNGPDPLDALIAQEEYLLRVITTDSAGNSYTWDFPRVSFATATALAGDTNTDVMVEFTFQMLEYQSANYAYTAGITRDAAVVGVLTAATDATNGPTQSTASVTTDSTGVLYAVVTTSATTPTHDQIVAGENELGTAADWSGSQAITAAGVQTLLPAPSGLTAATAYVTHFTQINGVGNSAPISAAGFTTDASVQSSSKKGKT